MDKKTKESFTYTGAVLMIDILGYGERIKNSSIEQIFDNLLVPIVDSLSTISQVTNYQRSRYSHFNNNDVTLPNPINSLFFSDTFLFYINTDNNDNTLINTPPYVIESMCYLSARILQESFNNCVALRGAISFGEFFIMHDPVVIIGQPIHEIAKLERYQQWAGIVLSDSIDHGNHENAYITDYEVPFIEKYSKKIFKRKMKVIDWTVNYSQEPDFDSCFNSDDEIVIIKKNNTIDFYNSKK